MNRHRKLEAWQACRVLIREVYLATSRFPAQERYGLTIQMRRAAVSSAANLAEGYARFGSREMAHASSVTLGSLAELDTLLAVAEDLEYLTGDVLAKLESLRSRASMLTYGLQRSFRKA